MAAGEPYEWKFTRRDFMRAAAMVSNAPVETFVIPDYMLPALKKWADECPSGPTNPSPSNPTAKFLGEERYLPILESIYDGLGITPMNDKLFQSIQDALTESRNPQSKDSLVGLSPFVLLELAEHEVIGAALLESAGLESAMEEPIIRAVVALLSCLPGSNVKEQASTAANT